MALDVGVARVGLGAQNGLLAAVQSHGDHLRHLGAGHDPGGIKVAAVFLAVDDVQSRQNGDGLGVDDLIRVGEIAGAHSTGTDGHHADQHGHGHYQAESPLEVSHFGFPPHFY